MDDRGLGRPLDHVALSRVRRHDVADGIGDGVLDAQGDMGGSASEGEKDGKKVHEGRWVSRSKYGVKKPKVKE